MREKLTSTRGATRAILRHAAPIALFVFTAHASAQAQAAPPVSQPSPVLEVDFRQDDPTFLRGEPITFAVRVLRAELDRGEEPVVVGTPEQPWRSGLGVRVFFARPADEPSAAQPRDAAADRAARALFSRPVSRIVEYRRAPGAAAGPDLRPLEAGPPAPRADAVRVSLEPARRGATLYYTIQTDDLPAGEHLVSALLDAPVARGDGPARTMRLTAPQTAFALREPATAADRARVARSRAEALTTKRDFQGAVRVLTAALPEAEADKLVHIELGLALERSGQLRQAIEQYEIYIAWARLQPHEHGPQCVRTPHHVADEFEFRVGVLRQRLAQP